MHKNKELFEKLNTNKTNISIIDSNNNSNIINQQNFQHNNFSKHNSNINKIGVKDTFLYKRDSAKLSKITEKSKEYLFKIDFL